MKWLLILALSTMAYAAPTCTYRQTGETITAMCTMPDGSGVETYISPTLTTEDDYTPEQWTRRLDAVTRADRQYVKAVDAIAESARLDVVAMKIDSRKRCQRAGFVWHRDGIFTGVCHDW